MSSAPRGLAVREGLECWLMKTGRTGPLVEPRRRPQAGKSGDPRSQNDDRPKCSSPIELIQNSKCKANATESPE